MPLRHLQESIEGLAREQAKVRGRWADVHAAHVPHGEVKEPRRDLFEYTQRTMVAAQRDDNLKSLPPAGEQFADHGRWMLQVRVHRDDHVATCLLEPRGES